MKKVILILLLSTAYSVSAFSQSPITSKGIVFENRMSLLKAPDCNASEPYIRKKIKAQLANFYTDYPWIAVDFDSFKGQNGYTDKKDPRRFVYPFKIEMLVYLKRPTTKDGKDATEYVIWKYDAVYEYATRPGGKCEFAIVPGSQITKTKEEVFINK